MIAIPNMNRPDSCFQCDNSACDHWGEYGYDNSADCPLIDIVHCKECIHFHYDKPYIIQGIPVLGHEVCDFWGDGCKTNPNSFCSYGERANNTRTE